MTKRTIEKLLPIAALLTGFIALPAGAASSAASSASDSVATSVGSLSGSLIQSSTSSSKDRQVADGDYRIIEIAAEEGRPDSVRLTLLTNDARAEQQASSSDEAASFQLIVPLEVLHKTGLTEGAMITARQRPYGLEFAEGQPRRAFYLALHDEWYRELQSTPVSL